MGLGETSALGLIAGVTIVLGMPLGRVRRPAPVLRLALNAVAIGVLLFLVWDVLTHAFDPIDTALGRVHDHTGGLAPVFGYGSLFAVGLLVGLMSLVYYERLAIRRRSGTESDPTRTAWFVAAGIGVHNLAEGLAIGGSAARGEIGLATVLVIGFALHNATEGFGIVAPLAGRAEGRPSWRLLGALALVGGGPTLVGTVVGHAVTSEPLSVVFLTLAAGSILYVVIQLLGVAARAGRRDVVGWGIYVGLLAGFVTDFVVTAGGA